MREHSTRRSFRKRFGNPARPLTLFPLPAFPEIRRGQNLAESILEAARRQRIAIGVVLKLVVRVRPAVRVRGVAEQHLDAVPSRAVAFQSRHHPLVETAQIGGDDGATLTVLFQHERLGGESITEPFGWP